MNDLKKQQLANAGPDISQPPALVVKATDQGGGLGLTQTPAAGGGMGLSVCSDGGTTEQRLGNVPCGRQGEAGGPGSSVGKRRDGEPSITDVKPSLRLMSRLPVTRDHYCVSSPSDTLTTELPTSRSLLTIAALAHVHLRTQAHTHAHAHMHTNILIVPTAINCFTFL